MPIDKKESARRSALAARDSIDAGERDDAARRVAARVADLPEARGVRSVLAYAAMRDELDPAFAVAALTAAGARIAFPRVCGPGELTLHWTEGGALTPGYCGIMEPRADAPLAQPQDFDLVLVPGVAFDESCCRLGHGGGFYDRMLPLIAPGAVSVGIAFEEQITDALPREAHDVHVDIIVTPDRVIRRPR
ncbi:MAG: 5-formyltetrahydrofolate cyclo-ligase [Coriobacteriia bacterium]|nr:5-formyltetrahydrofolate cyclo-ligase [Coriobacteriia bacterium]